MKNEPVTFETIKKHAVNVGAQKWAIQKWRQRGVPNSWRIKIAMASGGVISFADFDRIKTETSQGK